MRSILFAVVAAALAPPPMASQSISLRPGQVVTLHFENGLAVVDRTDAAEPMTKFDAYVLWRAQTQNIPPDAKMMPPSFVMKGEAPPPPAQPEKNQLKLTMRLVPGPRPDSPQSTALFIANGYDSKARYHAVMHSKGRSAKTDVCDVPPHFPGMEYWPYELDSIDVSELHLEPADGQIQCA